MIQKWPFIKRSTNILKTSIFTKKKKQLPKLIILITSIFYWGFFSVEYDSPIISNLIDPAATLNIHGDLIMEKSTIDVLQVYISFEENFSY